MISGFSLSRLPEIHFGPGVLRLAPELVRRYGQRVLLVTGARSFRQSPWFDALIAEFGRLDCAWREWRVETEPSPQQVDDAARAYRHEDIEVVLAIGGGSVLDAAKAVAGILPAGCSVMDYLEGVGPELPYAGPALPFIAVPTTAGTGSEATKNAVLSVQGKDGFKKSFRHELLVPRHAVVDPLLLASCPPALIAANGMDAFTQLLESFVSLRSNPLVDALTWSGLVAVRDSLLIWYRHGAEATEAHASMAYAALVSGISLAQAGLGSVHGMASPLGAFYPVPHGVACGTLVARATAMNIAALLDREPHNPALEKYAQVGRLMVRDESLASVAAREALVRILDEWTELLTLPRLATYGVESADLPRVVAHSRGSSMKTNPVELTDAELQKILLQRL